MLRMKHISSTTLAVFGSSSLTHMPLWPCWANLYFDGAMGNRVWPLVMVVSRWPWRIDSGRSLSYHGVHLRLVVVEIDLRRAADHVQIDDVLGLAGEVGAGHVRAGQRGCLGRREHVAAVGAQERNRRRAAQRAHGQIEKTATRRSVVWSFEIREHLAVVWEIRYPDLEIQTNSKPEFKHAGPLSCWISDLWVSHLLRFRHRYSGFTCSTLHPDSSVHS